MKITALLIIILFCVPSYGINYYRCEKTADCARAYGGCGRYLSVHKRYKELYEAKAHKADRVANCLVPSKKDKERKRLGKVSCLKESCRLLISKGKKEPKI